MNRKLIWLLLFLMIYTLVNAYTFGQNKVQSEILKWSKIETLHFDIYFIEGEDEFGKICALLAEEAYYKIKEDLKKPIFNRIPIVFFKSHQEFETTNIIYSLLNEGVGGFTELSRNRIVVPFDGSYMKMEQTLVHELTHAYINELNKTRSKFLNFSGLPFWFSEGFPEFLSVNGKDVYNNMFIIDLVMNDGIYFLDGIGGYFAYRLGESFLVYLNEVYGRESVIDLFYALRFTSTTDAATKKVFDLNFLEIQLRWKNHLKRTYLPYISDYDIPYEVFDRKTDHTMDGSYLNYAPRIAPDGNTFLYFSNQNITNDIWKNSLLGLGKKERIIQGGMSGKYEEFHFQKNNISWFPDGERFAFVAKTSKYDKIYVVNYKTGDIVYTFDFPQFEAVFEIDVSHDGRRIAFAGQKANRNDIYIYDIEQEVIIEITNDLYYDSSPRWSPDDSKILFASERKRNEIDEIDNVLSSLSSNVYYFDLQQDAFYQVTNDEFSNNNPFWSSNGDKVLMISERKFASNIELVDIVSGERAAVTNCLAGTFTGDISKDDEYMVFSCYFNGGWDIYVKDKPLQNLTYFAYQKPLMIDLEADFFTTFNFNRYKFYGKRKREFLKERPEHRDDVLKLDMRISTLQDSLAQKKNQEIDKKPITENIPQISPYKTKFSLDMLWGGMAYSPSGGTYAQLQLSFSDLMGNHGIGVNMGISGELDNSNFIFNYVYLARWIDYGIGIFYLNDEVIYQIMYADPSIDSDYFREREREYGFYTITRYPFNKFWRIDLENIFYRNEMRRDWWNSYTGKWKKEFLPDDFQEEFDLKVKYEENVWAPQISFVHDNAIYGSVGPVSGWRGTLVMNRNFSTEKSYSILFTDLRKYFFFEKRYSLAFRLFSGIILGETDQHFDMDYYNGIRGFDDDELQGSKKVICNAELRFPFIENLQFAFPIPLMFYNVRGSAFVDIGTVWEEDEDFMGMEGEILRDIKMGIGLGPRINLGYFVLKFDIAWNTNLEDISKPSYYLSLSPDF
jgi:Tol biopolymer transport system component